MDQRIRRNSGRRRRRRRRQQRRAAVLLICLVILIGAVSAGVLIIRELTGNYAASYEADNYNKNLYQGTLFASDLCVASEEVDLEGFVPDTDLHAAGLFNLDEDSVVCGYKLYDRLYPASTTKIMTALLALKYGNMDDEVTISSNATDFNWDEVTSGLRTGDKVSMYDLVCGLLLHSGNDCGTAIAEHIAGSEDTFADMMNEEAAALGATGTHFANPHGLHDENHYTTAYDLALIGKYAMQYETFREIASKTSYALPATDKYPRDDRLFNTTNDLIKVNHSKAANNYYYPYATAGKTGYTDAAQNCIVATAKKDDISLLVVVLHGERTEDGLSQRALDCKTLFEYGFNNYKHEVIAHKGDVAQEIDVNGGTNESKALGLVYSEDVTALVPINYDLSTVTPNIKLTENIYAPISEGTNLGSITFSIDGFDYSCDLIANHTVYKSNMSKTVIELCLILAFLFIFAKILKLKNKKAKRRYKHATKIREYSKGLDSFYPKL